MILVDASVWIDHFRAPDATLEGLLSKGAVLTHPYVIGEIALGQLRSRSEAIAMLRRLQKTEIARDPEVLRFIDRYKLYGLGIGYIDVHLLASTILTDGSSIWTRDKRLRAAAESMSIAAAGLK
jgi:predicted nucleic acid-binding protein